MSNTTKKSSEKVSEKQPHIFSIRETICNLRRKTGISKQELAERMGVNIRSIYRFEYYVHENPKLDTLYKLAEAMGKELVIRFKDKKQEGDALNTVKVMKTSKVSWAEVMRVEQEIRKKNTDPPD